MKKIIAVLLTVVIAAALFTGCTSNNPSPSASATPTPAGSNSPAATPTPEPVKPAEPTGAIKVAVSAVGNNLDPAVANSTTTSVIMYHVYDKLLNLDDNLNVIPGVATEWEQPDALTYNLTIGEGYKFSNGADMTMDDVVYSAQRMLALAQYAETASYVDSVTADGNVLTFVLNKPNSSFIKSLTSFFIVNKEYCESVGEDYANKPIGTGPYVVDSYVPGDTVVLKTWADYPFEKPGIETITFKGIPEASSIYVALESGDVQFAGVSAQDINRAKENTKLTVVDKQTTYVGFVAMNNQKAPFNDKNVRLAIASAFNKNGYAKLRSNYYTIDSMFPNMFNTYYSSPDYPTYDLEKAKEYLTAAGYSESNPLTFEASIYSASDPILEAFQADLKSIGVEMSIASLEFGVFLQNLGDGNYQFLSGGWNNVTGDALSAAADYWTGSMGMNNISFFDNARCDELYDIAQAAATEEELIAACKEIQEIAGQEVPMLPTFGQISYYGMDKNLVGVEVMTNGTYNFKKAVLNQ